MIYDIVIFIAILFFITTIIFIVYLLWNYSIVVPVIQPEHNDETGIGNAMLKTWPTLTYVEAKSLDQRTVDASCCSICLIDYEEVEGEDKALRLLQECGHLFHATCVDPWLRRRQTCPVCRSLVVNGAIQMPSAELISIEIERS